MRIELAGRESADEQSDEEIPSVVLQNPGIQRATLLETKGKQYQRTQYDITDLQQAQRVRHFVRRGDP